MYSWAHTSLSWYYKLNLWGYRDNQICEVVWHFFSKAQNWKSFHPNIKSRPTALCRYGKQQKWFIIWIYYLSYYLIIIIILLLSITGASYTDAAKPLRDLLCCAQIHTLQPSPQLHRLSFKKTISIQTSMLWPCQKYPRPYQHTWKHIVSFPWYACASVNRKQIVYSGWLHFYRKCYELNKH